MVIRLEKFVARVGGGGNHRNRYRLSYVFAHTSVHVIQSPMRLKSSQIQSLFLTLPHHSLRSSIQIVKLSPEHRPNTGVGFPSRLEDRWSQRLANVEFGSASPNINIERIETSFISRERRSACCEGDVGCQERMNRGTTIRFWAGSKLRLDSHHSRAPHFQRAWSNLKAAFGPSYY